MNSGKLQDTINDFNFHVIHSADAPSESTLTRVNLLKERVEGAGGSFKVTYESFSTCKIKGATWDAVFIDEASV